MEMFLVQYDQVQDVNANGLTYTDDDGNEHVVDFEKCYQNYLKPRLTQEEYQRFLKLNPNLRQAYKQYCKRVASWKEVAWRNAFGDSNRYKDYEIEEGTPWLLFHTDPPTLIRFPDHQAFYDLQARVQTGHIWHTWDSA